MSRPQPRRIDVPPTGRGMRGRLEISRCSVDLRFQQLGRDEPQLVVLVHIPYDDVMQQNGIITSIHLSEKHAGKTQKETDWLECLFFLVTPQCRQ